MKIFSAAQIREWDAYTIREEQITSLTLMERAAHACCRWLLENGLTRYPVYIFCGKGNNGGDGLAIARLLLQNNVGVTIFILETGKTGTPDFQTNLEKLHALGCQIHYLQSADFFPAWQPNTVIIDALFGSGINKPLVGLARELVLYINESRLPVVSIDMPSGLFTDTSSSGCTVITSTHTLSLECMKLAFLLPENAAFIGQLHLLPIGLSKNFLQENDSPIEITDKAIVELIYRPRPAFSHKGNFGHALLVAGSHGMMGAAVLAAGAALRSGLGKLTCLVPSCGYTVMQTTAPEALCLASGDDHIAGHPASLDTYKTIGIGPGIGQHPETKQWLLQCLQTYRLPMVLDADALNIISNHKEWLQHIPPQSVITPHPKEFERLFGSAANDFDKLVVARDWAQRLQITIVLKGHRTAICTPGGKIYFNSTGNAGMAKAGMGDVLTGLITGLLASGIPAPESAILGVYLHGIAGDLAAADSSEEAIQSSDIIQYIGKSWRQVSEGEINIVL